MSYFSGPINFNICLSNGYTVRIVENPSSSNLSLLDFNQVFVTVHRNGYRDLKLDAMLSDKSVLSVTPEELIICLNTVLSFNEQTDLPYAEHELRHNLHRTL